MMTRTQQPFGNVYAGRRVVVTGHTGFKGSWLTVWLRELGADVVGYALEPPTKPSHFDACGMWGRVTHILEDVRGAERLRELFVQHRPEVVFHLAAQALVQASYDDPKSTLDTNVGGTVNVLEAARQSNFVRAIVVVSSDKCYENREWIWGYRENDPLGGHDPYSASKACAELATSAYMKSFFAKKEAMGVASGRAGNVIGGGDWARQRILPDCVRALVQGQPIPVRNPAAIRPWQHVLEPLSGYLWLGALLMARPKEFQGAWNFGPHAGSARPVAELAGAVVQAWGEGSWKDISATPNERHEAGFLQLCCDKANAQLGWHATWDFDTALARTVEWYKAHYRGAEDMYGLTVKQIDAYVSAAASNRLAWVTGAIPYIDRRERDCE